MISAFRYAVFACLLIYAFAQTRGGTPSVSISDGAPAVAGLTNTLIIQVQNVQPGFRVLLSPRSNKTYCRNPGKVVWTVLCRARFRQVRNRIQLTWW